MNYELIALAVFVALLTLFLVWKRKKIEIQKILFPAFYFILYKTKLGLKSMDKIAKKKRLMQVFNSASVAVGFAGMALISILLLYNLYKIAFFPQAVSGVAIVLPIKAKGVFYVPFFYWIISILILATVHEFSHGMIARFNNIRIKSSGFAFLAVLFPIIPAAFVEPDEKQLNKKKTKQQLQVFAAGPFSNIVLGFACLGLFLLIAPPIANSTLDFNGVNITSISNNSVLKGTNISVGDSILRVDNKNITYVEDFVGSLQNKTIGQPVMIETARGNSSVELGEHPENKTKPYLGVTVEQVKDIKPGVRESIGSFIPNAVIWLLGLLYWLYLLNLGIGLFNLVPVGPIDGGRMVYTALLKKYRKDKAMQITKWISITFLLIIVLNILAGFVI